MKTDELKTKWLILNGFKIEFCPHRKYITYNYKGYSWTEEDIKNRSSITIKKYKDFYDDLITEKHLNAFLAFEKSFEKAIKSNEESSFLNSNR